MSDTDSFYLEKQEPNRSCLLVMRKMILNADNDITETQKYGMPCFCYKGKAFTYLWVDKKTHEPYFLLVEGKHLNHPLLEMGDRLRMKVLRVNSNNDLPVVAIRLIITQALDLYKKGTIKTAKQ